MRSLMELNPASIKPEFCLLIRLALTSTKTIVPVGSVAIMSISPKRPERQLVSLISQPCPLKNSPANDSAALASLRRGVFAFRFLVSSRQGFIFCFCHFVKIFWIMFLSLVSPNILLSCRFFQRGSNLCTLFQAKKFKLDARRQTN